MKAINNFSLLLLFLATFLVCLSIVKVDIKMLAAGEFIFFNSITLLFLTNKVLQPSKLK